MNAGRFREALNAYNRTQEIEGASAEIFCHIGACYEKMETFDLAVKYYQKAVKLDQLYHEAWFGLGVVLSIQKKFYEAVHFLTKATKLEPENALYWKSLAFAENSTGNIVSAVDAYIEASELDPSDAQTWLDWSEVYYDQGNYENAYAIVEGGLNELPDNTELLYRSVVYLVSANRYKEAFSKLEIALILDFEGHTLLFDFFQNPQTQTALFRIIEQYRKNER